MTPAERVAARLEELDFAAAVSKAAFVEVLRLEEALRLAKETHRAANPPSDPSRSAMRLSLRNMAAHLAAGHVAVEVETPSTLTEGRLSIVGVVASRTATRVVVFTEQGERTFTIATGAGWGVASRGFRLAPDSPAAL